MTLALTITMTQAGQARFTAAQLGNGIDLAISSVGLTDANFVVSPTLEALPGEFRRLGTISGRAVGDHVVHLTMRDDDTVGYTVRGFGLFLADGTLFAVYGQPDRLFEKSPLTTFLAAIDIAFPTADIDNLTFGNTDFLNPPATSETIGVVELATQAEADGGIDTRRVAPVAIMRATIASLVSAAEARSANLVAALSSAIGQALDGLAARTLYGAGLVKGGGRNDVNRTLTVDPASAAETRAGNRGDLAVTPSGLLGAGAVYVVAQSLTANGGYRVWSDGMKECWGAVALGANMTVNVPLPVPHDAFCIPTGSCSIAQDEASIGALNATAAGFDLRSRNPQPTTFYWHTKGR
jgi:hypothetical protein